MTRYFCDLCDHPAATAEQIRHTVANPSPKGGRIAVTGHFSFQDRTDGYGGAPDLCPMCQRKLILGLAALTGDYRDRVIMEKQELEIKRDKLRAFIGSDGYRRLNEKEQSRLNRQLDAMAFYSSVLIERIDADFK